MLKREEKIKVGKEIATMKGIKCSIEED